LSDSDTYVRKVAYQSIGTHISKRKRFALQLWRSSNSFMKIQMKMFGRQLSVDTRQQTTVDEDVI